MKNLSSATLFLALCTFLLALLLMPNTSAQNINTKEEFNQFVNKMDNHYDSVRIVRNGDMKGTGFNPYMRWKTAIQSFIYNKGTIAKYYDGLAMASENQSNSNRSNCSVSTLGVL